MTTDSLRRTASTGDKSRKKRQAGTVRNTATRALQLKGQLDIREVSNLKSKLARHLETNRPVILDASKLEKIDTSVMQLLTAFCLSANSKGIEVKWKNPNDRLLRAAELLDLSRPLGLENIVRHKPY
ncbi:MAG TPA: STAS domain-containing protein [Gammaproteobacteria bacterium]